MPTSQAEKRRAGRRGGRPTLDSAAEIRERLLANALEMFLAAGYGGASINAIAKEAAITRDTVYRQFEDKKALFLAATEYAFAAMAQHLREVIHLEDAPEEVLAKVIGYIHLDTRDDRSNSVIRLSIMEAYRFPEIAADMLQASYQFVEPLTGYLEHHRALGNLCFDDARETALLIANVASGGGHFYVDQGTPGGGDSTWVAQVVRLLLFGLKGAATGKA